MQNDKNFLDEIFFTTYDEYVVHVWYIIMYEWKCCYINFFVDEIIVNYGTWQNYWT